MDWSTLAQTITSGLIVATIIGIIGLIKQLSRLSTLVDSLIKDGESLNKRIERLERQKC